MAEVRVRRALPGDGDALLQAAERINNETEFLGVPGEGHPWDGRPAEELRRLEEHGYGVVFLALDGTEIVGYLSAFAGGLARSRGNIFIAVVGLREGYRGRGIGTRLFEAVEEWARARGAWRLELRVSSLNERGQGLYRKRGFAVEGTIRQGVLRSGVWTDDLWMGKLLDPWAAPLPAASLDTVSPRQSGRHGVGRLVVRELRAGDGAIFRDWEMRMVSTSPYALKLPGEVGDAETIERDIGAPAGEPRLWLVAAQPDMYGPEAIVAFATGSIELRFRMQHDAFVSVSVLPEWAGQGLGRRLHGRIEEWARGFGARRLTATISAPNAAGRGFAAALGYRQEVVMCSQVRFEGRPVDRLRLGKLLVG
jgi:GNAT superfamily N-acetyltransferase